jgi:hypothetical protein
MEKRVAAILVIAVLTLFLAASNGYHSLTGFQSLDLPEPPSPPGMESDQVTAPVTPAAATTTTGTATTTTTTAPKTSDMQAILARLDLIEQKIGVLPAWEQRLAAAEAQIKIAADMSSRLDAMQSQIDAMKVDIANLKQQPSFEAPFFDAITNLQGSQKKNAILSITLSVLALIVISGMIAAGIVQKKKTELEDKKLVRQYLVNYTNAGYKLETLRMHLQANGWDEKFIDERIKEIPR